jgi:hypothetical protein
MKPWREITLEDLDLNDRKNPNSTYSGKNTIVIFIHSDIDDKIKQEDNGSYLCYVIGHDLLENEEEDNRSAYRLITLTDIKNAITTKEENEILNNVLSLGINSHFLEDEHLNNIVNILL